MYCTLCASLAMTTFWRILIMVENQSSPVRVGALHAHFLSPYLPSCTKLYYTFQLRGRINFPYFYSTPLCALCLCSSNNTAMLISGNGLFKFLEQKFLTRSDFRQKNSTISSYCRQVSGIM